MDIIKFNDLEKCGHDVYEFCYGINYPNQWNDNSIFVDSDNIQEIQEYIDAVFENFHYYGPRKVLVSEWEKIRCLALLKNPKLKSFFRQIELWKNNDSRGDTFFWILGV